MKNMKSLLLGTIISLTSFSVYSQNPTYPAASPAASVSQTFGLTKVDINYSSPGVKGRQIWGALVPYDSVWRTGANKITDITFNTDVTVGGQKVKKGRYALATIPGKMSWTIILNSDADQWGVYSYKKSLDVARFNVSSQTCDMKERMTFMIEANSDSTATICLCWEKVKVSFDIMADTRGIVLKSIDDYANGTWSTYARAANYYLDNNLDIKKAQAWAMVSVNMKEQYSNCYTYARILHMQGNNKDALKYATEAKTLGDKVNDENYQNNYRDKIAKLIADCGTASGGKKK